MQLRNFIDVFLARHVFGYIRTSPGALDVELQRMVFCTEFLEGWWSWEPLRRYFKLFYLKQPFLFYTAVIGLSF